MFNKKYSFNASTVTKGVANAIQKGANALASLDNSGKKMAERIEEAIALLVNKDEDMQLILRRLAALFEAKVEFAVVPKVNDATLMIEEYALVLMYGGTMNQPMPILSKPNADELIDYLTSVILARDEKVIDDFCKAVETAANRK